MSIATNLQCMIQNIIAAEQQFARKPGSVKLLAVSKGQSLKSIQAAIAAGQRDFGENYVQEAIPKIIAASEFASEINWHFIGAIQSNKAKLIARYFNWVHSVTNLQHAKCLSVQRPKALPPLNICLQINIDNEETKAGITLEDLSTLVPAVMQLPKIRLRGLMIIPAPRGNFDEQREPFRTLRQVLQGLQNYDWHLDTLSMGMSADYLAAIAEGATLVRIGTAIFGQRSAKKIIT